MVCTTELPWSCRLEELKIKCALPGAESVRIAQNELGLATQKKKSDDDDDDDDNSNTFSEAEAY